MRKAAIAALLALLPLAASANDREQPSIASAKPIAAAHATRGQSQERFLAALQHRLSKWAHDWQPKKSTPGRCKP